MHKLFIVSHLRTLTRLNAPDFVPTQWEEVAVRNSLAPSGDGMLYRLPREELKHAFHTPCPINSLEQAHSEAIIKASKALRHHVKLEEQKICSKCPFVAQCPHAKLPYQPTPDSNSLRDILFFFYGLQNILKPDFIFYRQWVSAYRLGDSVIGAIQDLSKGGKEIQEYDRIRIQGIKDHQEKMALKKAQNATNPEFQKLMEKLESPSAEKSNKKANEGRVERQKPVETLGRDFSFDQQAEFEPVKKFNKETGQKQAQKGFQRIQSDNRSPRQPSKPNKFHPERESIEELEDEFKKQYPRGQNRKPFDKYEGRERSQRNDNFDRVRDDRFRDDRFRDDRFKDNRFAKNDRYDQNNRYDRNERDQKPRYEKEERGKNRDWPENGKKNDRYADSRDFRGQNRNFYDQDRKPSRRGEDQDYPKIREQGKRQPRDFQEQDFSTKTTTKSNPFVSKWKPEENSYQVPNPRPTNKAKEAAAAASASAPAAKPRIIDIENINQVPAEEGKQGRSGKRRKTRPSSTEK